MHVRALPALVTLTLLAATGIAAANCPKTAGMIADALLEGRGIPMFSDAFEVPIGSSSERVIAVSSGSADVNVVPCPLVRAMSFTVSQSGAVVCSGSYEGDPGESIRGNQIGDYPVVHRDCALSRGAATLTVRIRDGYPGASVAVRIY